MSQLGKSLKTGKELEEISSGQVCPMPAKGAMGSAALTILL